MGGARQDISGYDNAVVERGSPGWAAAQVTVPATAGGIVVAAARVRRQAVTVINHGTTDVWLGPDNTVSSTTGVLLAGVKGASVTIPTEGAVYGRTGAGTQAVSVIESIVS